MRMSASITKLAPAFVTAQAQVEGARKTSANPYFKSKYADLSEVWAACRSALEANGLGVIQFPVSGELGIGVETMLVHSSGEWLAESFFLPIAAAKDGSVNAQGGGSCITYARRYALAAVLGVCPEDDDGNAAAAQPRHSAATHRKTALPLLEAAAQQSLDTLQVVWRSLSNDERAACQPDLARLKQEASGHATASA